MLVLKALSLGPNHGYGISLWVRHRTDGELLVEDAALYQALHRLERQALIDAEWGLSENNRRAKFYALTPEGRTLRPVLGRGHLRAAASQWRRYVAAVFKVLEPA